MERIRTHITVVKHLQKLGTVKDVQGVMRHSRTATTTDVYMQEIPESVQATVNSINRELRGQRSEKNSRTSPAGKSGTVVVLGRSIKHGAVSVKVFGNLTPNDIKLGMQQTQFSRPE
jgi:hypothetical protein